ncbi:hypothetical protein CERZMDRAFT_95729 [Cercospora zeae-maydis SCOH1-5]|uniref:Uncharacterized protein n=1 Tax=Cercospora zeae-maydis SCOH1-5 TaxID=717836 RepID=A0A6A6FME2_9PEZI|nr:hypothetical protein CERZMDRAFT_95729 [Cercospora zeae-maydis SCOH1-5]
MRFEFTGAPPALLAGQGETSPFTIFSSAALSHPISRTPTPTTSGSTVAFGQSSVLGRFPVAASQLPNSGKGKEVAAATTGSKEAHDYALATALKSPLAAPQVSKSSKGKEVALASADRDEAHDNAAYSVLFRALRRFEKSKASPFAAKDAAADTALEGHVQSSAQAWVLERCLRKADPEVLAFVESIFGELVDNELPDAPLDRPSPDPADTTETPAPDAVDKTIKQSRAMGYLIPRSHPRIQQYGDTLKWKLLDEGFIHYEQGAYVLAKVIVGEMYNANTSPNKLDEAIKDALSRTTLGNIPALTNTVLAAFREMDDQFRNGELDSMQHTDADAYGDAYGAEDGTDNCDAMSDEPISEPSEHGKDISAEQTHFRFLDLPAELRNRVYVELLAPNGFIVLSRIDSPCGRKFDKPRSVESGSEIDILCVSKEIYQEAKSILYRDNTVCVAAAINLSTYPCIDTQLLPWSSLPLLASMTLVVDLRADDEPNNVWIDRANWLQLQKLTTLKHVRICFVETVGLCGENSHKRIMLKNILERIPADCQLTFESEGVAEIDFVQEVIEDHENHVRKRRHAEATELYEVDGKLLEKLVKEIKGKEGFEMGYKNGHERDYRFPPKPIIKSLQELIAEGAVDPKIVLGGGN